MSLRWAWPVLDQSAEFERGAAALKQRPAAVWVEGLAGTAKWFMAGALAERLAAPLLILTASEEAAEVAVDDLPAIGFRPEEVGLFPAVDDTDDPVGGHVLASSEAPERRAVARSRLAVLEALSRGELRAVVAPVHAVMRETIASLEESRLVIRTGEALDFTDTAKRLAEMGYERVAVVEAPGQFAIRGGLMDIYPSTRSRPTRIELFGDEIESLREFDLESQRSTREVPELTVVAATEIGVAGGLGGGGRAPAPPPPPHPPTPDHPPRPLPRGRPDLPGRAEPYPLAVGGVPGDAGAAASGGGRVRPGGGRAPAAGYGAGSLSLSR
jgi:transcription-repair coupling factor (superfamily II helicase)